MFIVLDCARLREATIMRIDTVSYLQKINVVLQIGISRGLQFVVFIICKQMENV